MMTGLRFIAFPRILALLLVVGVLAGGAAALAEETGTPVAAEEGGAPESGLLGKAADFQGKDIDGKTVSLKSLLGKGPIVVDFWATWCKPCIKALPHLERISQAYSDQGLSVLAISIDSPKTESRVKPFVLGKKYTFKAVLDPSQEIFRSLQGKGTIPYTVIIDKAGNIRYRHTGYRPGDENEVERVVKELLAGTGATEKSAVPDTEESAEPSSENSAG
jgi:peroxiredoxin